MDFLLGFWKVTVIVVKETAKITVSAFQNSMDQVANRRDELLA